MLVSDDLDSYKDVADELGLEHQICRNHVKRNVDDLVEALKAQHEAQQEAIPPGVETSPQQFDTDLDLLAELVGERPPEAPDHLEQLYHRYKAAPKPPQNQRHTVWYRMRMLITRLWERWQRLTVDLRREELEMDGAHQDRHISGWRP